MFIREQTSFIVASASVMDPVHIVGGRARMQRDEVGAAEQLLNRLNLFNIGLLRRTGRMRGSAMPERGSATCEAHAPPLPVSDDPERVVVAGRSP